MTVSFAIKPLSSAAIDATSSAGNSLAAGEAAAPAAGCGIDCMRASTGRAALRHHDLRMPIMLLWLFDRTAQLYAGLPYLHQRRISVTEKIYQQERYRPKDAA